VFFHDVILALRKLYLCYRPCMVTAVISKLWQLQHFGRGCWSCVSGATSTILRHSSLCS